MQLHKRKSFHEIRKIITDLNRIDLRYAEYNYLVEQINLLITGLPIKAFTVQKGTSIYRGVIYKDKPLTSCQLGYPPTDKVKGYQRCNPPGKPMFYASLDRRAIFAELGAKANDKVYISQWSVEREFFVIRVPPEAGEGLDIDPTFSKIETFFETKYAQPIHIAFSEQYKLTAAIAQKFMSPIANTNENSLNAVLGVVYPSVAYPSRSDNLALKPVVVDDYLELIRVSEYYVDDNVDSESWTVTETDYSSNFDNSRIQWVGRPSQWVLTQGETLNITVEADELGFQARKPDGSIVKPT